MFGTGKTICSIVRSRRTIWRKNLNNYWNMITERIAQQTLMSRIERRRCRKSTSNATDFVIFDRFCPKPLFQSEAKCETINMKMSFHSHANKTLSNEKGFTLSIVLKVRIFGTISFFSWGHFVMAVKAFNPGHISEQTIRRRWDVEAKKAKKYSVSS